MKQLQLKFHISEGKSKTLSVNYVDQELTGDQVKSAMEKIAATKIFVKGSVQLYDVPVSAKYVERTETPLFNDDTDPETPAPAPAVPAGR
jgi:hypothetical protein